MTRYLSLAEFWYLAEQVTGINAATLIRASRSLPPDFADAIEEAAKRDGTTVSAWIAATAAHRLRLEASRQGVAAWERQHGVLTATCVHASAGRFASQESSDHRSLRSGFVGYSVRAMSWSEVEMEPEVVEWFGSLTEEEQVESQVDRLGRTRQETSDEHPNKVDRDQPT